MPLAYPRRVTTAGLAALLCGLVAACGSSDSDESSTAPASTQASTAAATATTAGDDIVQTAAAKIAPYYEGEVKFHELPPAPKPEQSGHIFIIPCSAALEGCVRAANGAQEAAKLLGWKTTVIDGKVSPEATNAAVQRAVNEKADGIIMISTSTALAGEGVAAAHKAGIPIVTTTSGNTVGDGPKDVSAEIGSIEANRLDGELAGWWTVKDSGGKANALVLNDTSFTTAPPIADGFKSVLEQCEGCKVADTVDFTGAEVATRLAGKVQTALQRNPDVDYVFVPYGAAGTFASNAIRESGQDVKIVGTSGNASNIDQIRKGDVQVATVDKPLEYTGWEAIDALVRLRGGEEPAPFQEDVKVLDETNLPEGGQGWDGDSDYVPVFKQLWQLDG
jgi:ribose transport system substrate-binding protein